MSDKLRAALNMAFNLGQMYWRQADSESYSQNRRSEYTRDRFRSLVDETCEALTAQAEQAQSLPEQKPGQARKLLITTEDPLESGHWFSPDAVREMTDAARDLMAQVEQAQPVVPEDRPDQAHLVAWMTFTEDGTQMLWPTHDEAMQYVEDDEQPVPLYTKAQQAEPREPAMLMLSELMRGLEIGPSAVWSAASLYAAGVAIATQAKEAEPREPLSDAEIQAMLAHFGWGELDIGEYTNRKQVAFARAIERAHGIGAKP